MKPVWAIAKMTIQEAIRNRILYLLFFFAVLMVSFSWIIGKLTVGDEIKIIKDLGLSSIHFFGTLITVIIGVGLVFREMEKRTIYLVLSKPIRRYQFLAGKYCGLALTLLGILLSLGGLFYVILVLKGEPSPRPLLALIGIYQEWLLMSAVALMFSSFSTPLLSVMLTLATFFSGHLSSSLILLRNKMGSAVSGFVLTSVYYALPDLETFNIRAQMVHGLPVPPGYFLDATLYWVLYVTAVLLFSVYIFQKKDFV